MPLLATQARPHQLLDFSSSRSLFHLCEAPHSAYAGWYDLRAGDGGIDGVIDQDALGLDRVDVQAKRYALNHPVSEPDVRAFSGSIGAAKANKGVFVTTSYFTEPAERFVERAPHTIVLIDGERLADLMIRHSVGTRSAETLYLKKIDEDFFSDE